MELICVTHERAHCSGILRGIAPSTKRERFRELLSSMKGFDNRIRMEIERINGILKYQD